MKLINFLLIPFLVFLSFHLLGQDSISVNWSLNYGANNEDVISSLSPTKDGGYIMAGYTNSNTDDIINNGLKDVWVIKTDGLGQMQWQRNFGGSQDDEGVKVLQDDEGNYFILATSWSNDGDIAEPIGDDNANIWLLKLNSLGELINQQLYGGLKNDYASNLLVCQSSSVHILANAESSWGGITNQGGLDVLLVSVNPNDLMVNQIENFGDNNDDYGIDIIPTLDNGYMICGKQIHPDSTSNAASLFYFLKLDENQNLEWQSSFGGSLPDIATSILQIEDGSYWSWGHSCSPNGDLGDNIGGFDFWLLGIDAQGNLQERFNYGGSKNDFAEHLYLQKNGDIVLLGRSDSEDVDITQPKGGMDYWYGRVNASTGELEESKNFGGSLDDELFASTVISEREWIVAGSSLSNDGDIVENEGEKDAWIVSLKRSCIDPPLPIIGSIATDSLALVHLYEQTEGTYWIQNNNWLTTEPIENWYGIETANTCSTGEKRVIKIDLPNNQLTSNLSNSINTIYYLESINVENNQIKRIDTLFYDAYWQSMPPPTLNINNNQIRYDDLLKNACVLSNSNHYRMQNLDLKLEYRFGEDRRTEIPFYRFNNNPLLDYGFGISDPLSSENNPATFSWFFRNEMIPDSSRSILEIGDPFEAEEAGPYNRIAHYPPFENDELCPLDSVTIESPISLFFINYDEETEEEYVSNQTIILFNDTTSVQTIEEYEDDLIELGGTKVKECPCGPTIQLWSVDSVELETVREGAQSKAGVDTTEFNYLYTFEKEAIGPNTQISFNLLARDMVRDGSYFFTQSNANNQDVKVGIIDSGVEPSIGWFSDFIWQNPEENDTLNCVLNDEIGYDFINDIGDPIDRNNHGTPINGIIGANFQNDGLELINGKFYDGDYGQLFEAVCAMHYTMDEGVQVLNMSWGYTIESPSFILEEAIQRAFEEDVLIITSAGNLTQDIDSVGKWPANFSRDYENMIVVGAYEVPEPLVPGDTLFFEVGDTLSFLDDDGELLNFGAGDTLAIEDILLDTLFLDTIYHPVYSNYGDNTVHLVAPGTSFTTSSSGFGFSGFTGTSMSTPYLTRGAAIAMNEFPDLSIYEIKDCMLSTVDIVPDLDTVTITSGVYNFNRFYECLTEIALVENPVYLSGRWQDKNTAILEIEISRNHNNARFILQKSADGLNWSDIHQINGEQQLGSKLIQSVVDSSTHFRQNYYRVLIQHKQNIIAESNEIILSSEQKNKQLTIYPNPIVGNRIFVESKILIENGQWKIQNSQGQTLITGTFDGINASLALPNLSSGFYYFSIIKPNGGVITEKFLIP